MLPRALQLLAHPEELRVLEANKLLTYILLNILPSFAILYTGTGRLLYTRLGVCIKDFSSGSVTIQIYRNYDVFLVAFLSWYISISPGQRKFWQPSL